MSVLPELEKRLSDSEGRIAALIQNLEDHAGLEQSLRTASGGLRDASVEVKLLAESIRTAIESLTIVLASFRDAVEILRQADPARATEAIARIEEKLGNAERGIREAVDEAAGTVSSGQEKAEHRLGAAVTRIEEKLDGAERRVREAVDEAAGAVARGQEKAEHQLGAEASAIRKNIPTVVSYIILALVLVLVGFEILRHFPEVLSG